ncbi:MAG TPA: hypothetical protein VM182_02630 [Terriglobia bacterium]|nr:hypothetical protein [Terriglobia bacterium]
MIVASLILIISTGLFFFYFQVTCQRILRRRFERDYFLSIVNANRLEFPAVRKALEDFDAPVDYPRVRMTLKCDYLALSYLLKNAANVDQRYTREERLLMLYFRVVFFFLGLRHALKLGEKSAIINLTAILQYFANVVGKRVTTVRFGNLAASDYLLSL